MVRLSGRGKASGLEVAQTGSNVYVYSAERPERVRGPNLTAAWADEMAPASAARSWRAS